jgi:hypothetical protein
MAHYHSVFVEPGPLPPHERTWRHPSELGPTSADVVHSSSSSPHGKLLAIASGALAVAVITAIVVTATPRPSSQPTALSATTLPPFVTSPPTALRGSKAPSRIASAVKLAEPNPVLASFTPIPNEIASSPLGAHDEPEIADELPETDDAVTVQTDDVTYHCQWDEIRWLDMPDGTIIVDTRGDLVAEVTDGELVALVP